MLGVAWMGVRWGVKWLVEALKQIKEPYECGKRDLINTQTREPYWHWRTCQCGMQECKKSPTSVAKET